MEKKLEVKDLRISFRTANGKVQAVRDISFDLYEGETLAIVGESGSGKSVTTRAIMGISAGNAILENGEIIYDGKDLVKFSEEDFQEIRGNKIAMIFQDPMSSLNPIVKVGKQLTEGMLLKNKADRKNGKHDFYGMLKKLKLSVSECEACTDYAGLCKIFVRVEKIATRQEAAYRQASQNANEALARIRDLLVAFEKKQESVVKSACAGIYKYASKCNNRFMRECSDEDYSGWLNALKGAGDKKQALCSLKERLEQVETTEDPDFFAIAYYELFSGEKVNTEDISLLNEKTRKYCADFSQKFVSATQKSVLNSEGKHAELRQEALSALKESLPVFKGDWNRKQIEDLVKVLSLKISACIDPLSLKKDNAEYTFGTSMRSYVERYFIALKKNRDEIQRFEKQTKKRDAILANGKSVDWKVTPAALTDTEALKNNAVSAVNALISLYEATANVQTDGETEAKAIVQYLKTKASLTVSKMTKTAAKRRAIRLLNEVGIPEPEKRFTQYPFQLSGGQRQRIVIAIALSANPDILICDEPTTALDVTIQAQTLELIKKVKQERNLSVIFITHDLGVVANIADRIAVMYAGKIVEIGKSEEIFYEPAHPYTWALLSSVPDLESSERLEAIPGTPPNMIYPPEGDAFAERNKYALEIDFKQQAPMFKITETHYAATWLLHPLAPKVEIPTAVRARIARMKKESDNGR